MLSASSSRLFQPQHRHTLNYKHPSHTGCLRSCTPHALHLNSRGKNAASSAVIPHATSPAGAVILEADGTLTDLHMDGHRVAFNNAFRDLGFECAHWTPAIYHDLLSKGDGTGEGLVRAYYNCVGWPTFLPTAEQDVFAAKVYSLKQQQMKKLVQAGKVPLRDGVAQVLSQALAAGFKIAVLTETCSDPQDDVVTCLLQQLPPDVAAAARVYSTALSREPVGVLEDDGEDSSSDQQAGGAAAAAGGSSSSSLQASLSAAATRVKQKGAQEFVQRMAAALEGKDAAVQVHLDPLLQQAGSSQSANSTALLAAVAATLDVPASRCLAIASSSDIINAAAATGMVAIAVPRKMAYAASYPRAAAKFEAFGPGYATFARLQSLMGAAVQ